MPYPRHPVRCTGLLDVGDARIFWEESGTPSGTPALWLHGGPGGSLGTGSYRSWFDPDRYRIVGIEQRGTGRSTPAIGDAPASLAGQTTQRLIADIEAVRAALGIDRWVVAGVSWGTTLGLAYAQEHPDRVIALALVAVTTTSRAEVEWITEGVGRFFPAEWDAFAAASGRRTGERVVDAYARMLTSGDPAQRARAAEAWDLWENVHVSLDHPELRDTGHVGPDRREGFATLVTHYWSHDGFLTGDRAIHSRVGAIAHIPTALVHGRRDISGPPDAAYRLHRALPLSTLTIVDDEGHGGEQEMAALTAALDAFAGMS